MTSGSATAQSPKPVKVDQSLTDRTFTGLFWMFGGSVSQAILKLLVLIVMARLLSPAEFGLVGAALVVVSFGQIASQLGIGPAIVQRPGLNDDHLRAGFALSMILAAPIGIVVYMGAGGIAAFFRMDALAPIVQIMAFIFPIAGLGIVAESLIQREMRFKALAGIELSSYALGYGCIGIVLALHGFGVWALVFAQLSQTTLKTVFVWLASPHSVGFAIPMRVIRNLVNYGTGLSIAKVGNAFAQQADNIVVGRWMGAEALGIYGRAYSMLMMPTNLIGSVLDKVLFPAMAEAQGDPVRLAGAYRRAVASVALVALPASGMLIVVAPELIGLLLGERWMGVVLPMQMLAVILVFRIGYKLSDSLARALGAVYRRAWRQWIYAAAVFGGAWSGHFWGLWGVAVGVVLAVALNYLLMLQLSVKLIGVPWLSILRLHAHYLSFAFVISFPAWLASEAGRNAGLTDLAIIGTALAVAAGVLLVLQVLRVPWLEREGGWIVRKLVIRVSKLARGQ